MDLKELGDARERLGTELVRMGLAFIERNYLHIDGPHSPALRQLKRRVLDLRDSVQYRATSINWHAAALYQHRAVVRRRFEEDVVASLEDLDDPMPLIQHIRQQSFLLDDILFNTISMFDYLGHLIGLMRLGGKKYVWSGVVRQCSRIPCPVAAGLAKLIVEADVRWIARLDQFRDDLIHYEDVARNGRASFDMERETTVWQVWMPPEWKPHVAALGLASEGIEIEDAGLIIARAAFDTGTGIVHALWETYPWAGPPWVKKVVGGVP